VTEKAHEVASKSMVRIRCCCGWLWHNEQLKGKTDLELEAEINFEWKRHQEQMKEAGF
jgi:hypothetical protein